MTFAFKVCLAAVFITAEMQEHDHAPRWGGAQFPAAGDTMHIEGVWPEQRRFKLFVSDPAGRLLPIDRLHAITGRLVIGDRTFPLALTPGEPFLVARIPSLPPPARMTVQVSLTAGAPEEAFEFVFPTYSDESLARGETLPTVIPPTLPGILAALRDDRRDAQSLVERGELIAVAAPGDRIRDRVLALEAHLVRLPAAARPRAEASLFTAVREAWLLHTATDYGVNAQVIAALASLGAALDEVEVVFKGAR